MLAEVLDVMRRPSIQALHRRDERGIRRVVARLFKLSSFVPIVNWKSGLVPQDPKDDQIVLTAIVGHADMLCSRDRHLFHPDVLALCSQHGIRVVKDKDLLAELQST